MTNSIYAITGHRPDKLGGYSPQATRSLQQFAFAVLRHLEPDQLISGMAPGWDQACARAATQLAIPWIAAVPFEGQEAKWPAAAQSAYHQLLQNAEDVETVCPGGYAPWKFQKRNEYMAQWAAGHLGSVLGLWNGTRGGTANMVAYSASIKLPILNAWEWWSGQSQQLTVPNFKWSGPRPKLEVTDDGYTITYQGKVIDQGPANSKFAFTLAAGQRSLQRIIDEIRVGIFFPPAPPAAARNAVADLFAATPTGNTELVADTTREWDPALDEEDFAGPIGDLDP